MKVQDLMTRNVQYCLPETNLASAAELMWTGDCGVLPVVSDGNLTGVITDRDICMALATRNCTAAELEVGDVATPFPETCEPDSDIHAALALMRRAKIRRLPVTENGHLKGILALNDVIEAVNPKRGEIDYEEVMGTMKAICEHRNRSAAIA